MTLRLPLHLAEQHLTRTHVHTHTLIYTYGTQFCALSQGVGTFVLCKRYIQSVMTVCLSVVGGDCG